MAKSRSKSMSRKRTKKARKSKSMKKVKRSKSMKTKKRKGKRKMNEFFKLMLAAKKKKAASFVYKGKTYVGRVHKRLGMIYKKK
jgi:hypothetical protein